MTVSYKWWDRIDIVIGTSAHFLWQVRQDLTREAGESEELETLNTSGNLSMQSWFLAACVRSGFKRCFGCTHHKLQERNTQLLLCFLGRQFERQAEVMKLKDVRQGYSRFLERQDFTAYWHDYVVAAQRCSTLNGQGPFRWWAISSALRAVTNGRAGVVLMVERHLDAMSFAKKTTWINDDWFESTKTNK